MTKLKQHDLTERLHTIQSVSVGCGGQAEVYKGSLMDGSEVAIKRFNIQKREGLKWAKVKSNQNFQVFLQNSFTQNTLLLR